MTKCPFLHRWDFFSCFIVDAPNTQAPAFVTGFHRFSHKNILTKQKNTICHNINHSPMSKESPKNKLSKDGLIPKVLKDGLRLVVAVRGYDNIKQGSGMNVNNHQREEMLNFFHGNSSNRPSQIELLASGKETPYDSLCWKVFSKINLNHLLEIILLPFIEILNDITSSSSSSHDSPDLPSRSSNWSDRAFALTKQK